MAMKVSDPTRQPISYAQASRLWAIAYSAAEARGYSKQDVSDRVLAVIGSYGFDAPEDVTRDLYETICERLENWE